MNKFNIKILICVFFIPSIFLLQEADNAETANPRLDSTKVTIHIPGFSSEDGRNVQTLHHTCGQMMNKSFKVQVLYDNIEPVESWPVYFNIISTPEKSEEQK